MFSYFVFVITHLCSFDNNSLKILNSEMSTWHCVVSLVMPSSREEDADRAEVTTSRAQTVRGAAGRVFIDITRDQSIMTTHTTCETI